MADLYGDSRPRGSRDDPPGEASQDSPGEAPQDEPGAEPGAGSRSAAKFALTHVGQFRLDSRA